MLFNVSKRVQGLVAKKTTDENRRASIIHPGTIDPNRVFAGRGKTAFIQEETAKINAEQASREPVKLSREEVLLRSYPVTTPEELNRPKGLHEEWSSWNDTVKVLESLGFTALQGQENHFLSKTGKTIAKVYLCRAGYWCVVVNPSEAIDWTVGIWGAPVVWHGPKAEWDKKTNSDLRREFHAFIVDALAKDREWLRVHGTKPRGGGK